MPFVCRPGLTGKIYMPEESPGLVKKHDCKNCFACQACGNDRCRLCFSLKSGTTDPIFSEITLSVDRAVYGTLKR